jgi:hypothetical protein
MFFLILASLRAKFLLKPSRMVYVTLVDYVDYVKGEKGYRRFDLQSEYTSVDALKVSSSPVLIKCWSSSSLCLGKEVRHVCLVVPVWRSLALPIQVVTDAVTTHFYNHFPIETATRLSSWKSTVSGPDGSPLRSLTFLYVKTDIFFEFYTPFYPRIA